MSKLGVNPWAANNSNKGSDRYQEIIDNCVKLFQSRNDTLFIDREGSIAVLTIDGDRKVINDMRLNNVKEG